jgi:cell division protein FtsB
MRVIHTLLTVILGLALIVSLTFLRRSRQDLQRQLLTVMDANSALKETLGELTVEITKKEQEIDRLQSPCREDQHESMPPNITPARASNTGSIGAN